MNILPGDVLMCRDDIASDKPLGRMYLGPASGWAPISFFPNTAYLVLDHAFDETEQEVEFDVVALQTGDKISFIISVFALENEMTVLRDERVVSTF